MKEHRIKLDQLIRIAEEAKWEAFEAMPDGRLLLQDHAQTLIPGEEDTSPLLWVFEMRVGLHFERPMQAIMSCGQFVRMRSARQWEQWALAKLDPTQPSRCLYSLTYPSSTWPQSTVSWVPQVSTPQQQVAGQQQIAGQYPAGTVWLGPNQSGLQGLQNTAGGGPGGLFGGPQSGGLSGLAPWMPGAKI